jgi:hypothetical protein
VRQASAFDGADAGHQRLGHDLAAVQPVLTPGRMVGAEEVQLDPLEVEQAEQLGESARRRFER